MWTLDFLSCDRPHLNHERQQAGVVRCLGGIPGLIDSCGRAEVMGELECEVSDSRQVNVQVPADDAPGGEGDVVMACLLAAAEEQRLAAVDAGGER